MGKQGADARPVLGVEENELGLAVFERDSVVGLDLHRSERVATSGKGTSHQRVIARIEQRAECDHGDKRSFHSLPRLYAVRGPSRGKPPGRNLRQPEIGTGPGFVTPRHVRQPEIRTAAGSITAGHVLHQLTSRLFGI